MKIAIVTNFLYPEGIGGTEIYCQQLATALVDRGNEVFWMVPNFKQSVTKTETRGNGIQVVKFAGVDSDNNASLEHTTTSFLKEMMERGISIAHFHEFGAYDGISPELLPACKKAGIATVVTFHLANYICKTGTMHFAGSVPCNGKMVLSRCSSCYLFSNKTAFPAINIALANIFDTVLKAGLVRTIPRVKTFLGAIGLKTVFIQLIREHADKVVSLTDWFKDVLLINGFQSKKIEYIPQISPKVDTYLLENSPVERKNFVFVGRVNKEKGVDLILDIAAKLKKEFPDVFIDLYGAYTPMKVLPHTIIDNLKDYDNVRYKGVLHASEVLPVMNKYKAVILPSRVAEMAPLIIMEAVKLKVPVIVSDVPGSAELVRKNDCGIVFNYASAESLLKVIARFENENQQFKFEQPFENSYKENGKLYEELYSSIK